MKNSSKFALKQRAERPSNNYNPINYLNRILLKSAKSLKSQSLLNFQRFQRSVHQNLDPYSHILLEYLLECEPKTPWWCCSC